MKPSDHHREDRISFLSDFGLLVLAAGMGGVAVLTLIALICIAASLY